jgi:hypothetical protein
MANEFKIKKGLIVTGASGGTVVDIQGSQGQLFSVTDDLSGSIFAVSDISGVPILDVNSSGLSTFDGNLSISEFIYHTGDIGTNIQMISGQMVLKNSGGKYINLHSNGTTYFESSAYQFNTGNANFAGDVTVSGGDLNVGNSSTVNSVINMLGTNDSFIEKDTGNHLYFANNVSDKDIRFRIKDDGTNVIALTIDGSNGGDSTFVAQAFSAATSSGDASSTLTTKGYVDGLITGATIYRGAWDPSGGGYGSPDLSGVTQTSGYYYICSAAGTAEPNGTGTEPDTWETGDWVIYNDVSGTGQWQKIDNSSVLSGVGTGQTVALWEGAGSITDSETLGNAPITISGNNATFAGSVTGVDGTFTGALTVGTTAGSNISMLRTSANYINATNATGYLVFRTGGYDTALTLDTSQNATFAGTVNADLGIVASGAMSSFETTLSNEDDWVNSPITILERGNVQGTQTADKYAPNLNFHWGGKFSASLWMSANGHLHYGQYGATGIPASDGTINAATFLGELGATSTINTGVTGTTQSAGNNSTLIATTAYADAAASAVPIGNYLPLAGGTMTGVTQFNDHTQHGDQVSAKWGASNDLTIQHNGTNSGIANSVGNLYISNHADDKDIIFESDNGSGASVSYLTLDGSTTHAYFSNPGNVGIGTSSPDAKLENYIVSNSDSEMLRLTVAPADASGAKPKSIIGFYTPAETNTSTYKSGRITSKFDSSGYANTRVTLESLDSSGNFIETLSVKNSNVGIGTTSPTDKLYIKGDNPNIVLYSDTLTGSLINFIDQTYQSQIMGSQGTLVFNTGGTSERMRITSNGNVGIGTTTPGTLHGASYGTTKLHIDGGTDRGQLVIEGDVLAGIILSDNGATANQRVFQTSVNGGNYQIKPLNDNGTSTVAGAAITVLHNSNVGIGTTNPNTKLHVGGIVQVTESSNTAFYGGNYLRVFNSQVYTMRNSAGSQRFAFDNSSGSLSTYNSSNVRTTYLNNTGSSYLNGGNVGIGNTAPGTKLHVGSGSGATVDAGYQMVIDSAGIAGLQILSATTQSGRIVFGDSGDNDIGMIKYDHTDNSMGFRTNGSGNERMRIDSSGNVGIGTTAPNAKLDIQGTQGQLFSVTDDLSGDIFSVADISGVPIMNVNSDGTSYFDGNVGIGTTSPSVPLQVNVTGNNTVFKYTRDTGTNGAFTLGFSGAFSNFNSEQGGYVFNTQGNEKFRINANGNVGIGTTSPGTKLDVSGQIRSNDSFLLQSGTTAIGSIRNHNGALDIRGDSTRDVSLGSVTSPQALFIEGTNGNVGIGTTSPLNRLFVTAATAGDYAGFIENTNATNGYGLVARTAHTGTSAYAFAARAGTSDIFVVRGDGNVGIGTTSPTHLLNLSESDSNSVQLVIDNTNTTDAGTETSEIRFRHYRSYVAGQNDAGEIIVGKEQAWDAAGDRNSYMSFGTRKGSDAVVEKMRITSDGNVGIGTDSPDTSLTIKTGSSAGLAKISSDANGAAYSANGDVQLYTNNSVYAINFFSANK